ncbi:M protein [Helicobacter pylori]|nr:M protein [Helicobacter pylori]
MTDKNKALTTEKENLTKANNELTGKNQKLTTEKTELTDKNKELDSQVGLLKGQIKSLEQSQQVLENEKAELKAEKDNLTTDLSNAKSQVIQAKKEKDKLEQKYAPYKKLEKLYEVFLEVKGCLNFGFVEKTHSAMDLIASVLSDSKYYLESLYNKASQELSDKRSDKGEKLAELFDLLFEYVKDNKFERLKEPSAYDSTCKKLYPEQNTSGKMQRVVLIGYTYDKKTTYCTIVDMGS